MMRGLAPLAGLGLAGAVALAAFTMPSVPPEPELSRYATSLIGRSWAQRRNARLAARALDGLRLGPGEEMSFNRTVGPWEQEPGYVRAPVSVDGAMVSALGGGVCQTSSTLYNAALLAGLTVLERHPHTVAPGYVAPGRDAAVAWPGVDLRLRNPWPFRVRLHARVDSDKVEVWVSAPQRPRDRYRVVQRVVAVEAPGRRPVAVPPGRKGSRGGAGYETATVRLRIRNGDILDREHLSSDHYPAVDRLDPIVR